MIKINPDELAAIALAASREEVRSYLCGVFVEQYAGGLVSLAATDGHRAHTLRIQQDKQPESSFILSNNDIKRVAARVKEARAAAGRSKAHLVFIEVEVQGLRDIQVNVGWQEEGENPALFDVFHTQRVDGNFPDYRRIFPARPLEQPGAPVQFNTALLHDFGKAAKLLSGGRWEKATIHPGGASNEPILITLEAEADFLGVLMPFRRTR